MWAITKMICTYSDCIVKFNNDYGIRKAIDSGTLFKVEPGIYSTKQYWDELSVILCKYPNSVFTLQSAWYYHGLSDEVPDRYFIASPRDGLKMVDSRVRQHFISKHIFDVGLTMLDYQGTRLRVYDKERMLIELIRNRNKVPFDYYKEVIGHYRDKVQDLNVALIDKYLQCFERREKLGNTIQLEVF